MSQLIGKNVLIRADASGVHVGKLLERTLEGGLAYVLLENAMRIWEYEPLKGVSLSGVAVLGLKNPKNIGHTVPLHEIYGVCEMMAISDEAYLTAANAAGK